MAESTKLFYDTARAAATTSADVLAAGGSKGETIVANLDGSSVGGVTRRSDAFNAEYNGASSASNQSVKTATASMKHYVTDLMISTDTAQTITIRDGASTVLFGPFYLPANCVVSKPLMTPKPGSTNTAINVVCSGAVGNVTVNIGGYTAV